MIIEIRVNGTAVARGTDFRDTDTAAAKGTSVSALIALNAGDVVTIYGQAEGSTAMALTPSQNFFTGYLVR